MTARTPIAGGRAMPSLSLMAALCLLLAGCSPSGAAAGDGVSSSHLEAPGLEMSAAAHHGPDLLRVTYSVTNTGEDLVLITYASASYTPAIVVPDDTANDGIAVVMVTFAADTAGAEAAQEPVVTMLAVAAGETVEVASVRVPLPLVGTSLEDRKPIDLPAEPRSLRVCTSVLRWPDEGERPEIDGEGVVRAPQGLALPLDELVCSAALDLPVAT